LEFFIKILVCMGSGSTWRCLGWMWLSILNMIMILSFYSSANLEILNFNTAFFILLYKNNNL